MGFMIKQDIAVLRELVKQYAEVAALPEQAEKIRLWQKLNGLEPERPMFMIDQLPWNELEYGDIPANDYYRDGYNLFLRMEKYMRNHLLFLHDLRVPATNNEAERLLRNYKRKQAQAVTFRSFESIDYLCQCMSMLVLMRREEPANIFDRVSRIFG